MSSQKIILPKQHRFCQKKTLLKANDLLLSLARNMRLSDEIFERWQRWDVSGGIAGLNHVDSGKRSGEKIGARQDLIDVLGLPGLGEVCVGGCYPLIESDTCDARSSSPPFHSRVDVSLGGWSPSDTVSASSGDTCSVHQAGKTRTRKLKGDVIF